MKMDLMLKWQNGITRLKDAAENAKKSYLLESTEINTIYIYGSKQDLFTFVKSLTRAKFESMTEDLIDETLSHIKVALKRSRTW